MRPGVRCLSRKLRESAKGPQSSRASIEPGGAYAGFAAISSEGACPRRRNCFPADFTAVIRRITVKSGRGGSGGGACSPAALVTCKKRPGDSVTRAKCIDSIIQPWGRRQPAPCQPRCPRTWRSSSRSGRPDPWPWSPTRRRPRRCRGDRVCRCQRRAARWEPRS